MIASLAEAFSAVNSPEEDAIFQVTVRRGVPADAFAITGETFEFYPVGGKQKKYTEMSEEELSAEMARNTARRRVLVPAMIVDPKLSYTPVTVDASEEAVERPPDDDAEGFPVGLLSERFMRTLFESHRVTNIPEAGLKALHRFLRSSADTAGTDTGGEPVGRAARRWEQSRRMRCVRIGILTTNFRIILYVMRHTAWKWNLGGKNKNGWETDIPTHSIRIRS